MAANTEAKATKIKTSREISITPEELNAIVNQLKSNRHPICVFNSQTVEDYNKMRLKAKIPLKPVGERLNGDVIHITVFAVSGFVRDLESA